MIHARDFIGALEELASLCSIVHAVGNVDEPALRRSSPPTLEVKPHLTLSPDANRCPGTGS